MNTNENTTSENRPRAIGRRVFGVLSIALLGLGAATLGVAVASTRVADGRIAAGVKIADVPVGQLTRDEAREKVLTWARSRMARPVVLRGAQTDRKWAITIGELGGRFAVDAAIDSAAAVGADDNIFEKVYWAKRARPVEISPAFAISDDKIDAFLKKIGNTIRQPAKNARAKMGPNDALILVAQEQKGIELDTEATRASLTKGGPAALADGADAKIVVKESEPKVTAADLGKMGTLLAAYTTDYGGSSSNRKHNVGLCASSIDGTILGPGEVFSYNKIVGPREANLGWRMAHQYQDGQVVDGIGGGVCQGSSTLYNALLMANLKIVERHNHSMPVAYVRAGRDATVSYGSLDLQFENSTPGPIYVAGRANGDEITFRIYGTAEAAPPKVKILSGERRYTSSGGFNVSTWKDVVDETGVTKRLTISSDYYRPPAAAKPRVVRRPAARKPSVTASAAPAKPAAAAPENSRETPPPSSDQ